MSTLFRTTVVLIAVNLITAGIAPAQDEQAKAEMAAAEIAAKEAQEQLDAKNKELEALMRQLQDMQQQVDSSKVVVPMPAPAPQIRFSGLGGIPFHSKHGGSILVIPSAEMNTEDIRAIHEDMTVMSSIFAKRLNQQEGEGGFYTYMHSGYRYNPFIGTTGSAIRAMYLQDYGAVFLMKVDFPLSPSEQEIEEEKETEEEDADPIWQETRRDIYDPQQSDKRGSDRPEEKYEPEKVDNLKTTLVAALKHASNIRGLKQDESVILTITGSDESSGLTNIVISTKVNSGKERTEIIGTPRSSGTGPSSPTMLVIRAKKSDIDEFATGDVNSDQFRGRVQILTCPYLGESFSSVSSFSGRTTGTRAGVGRAR